MKKTLLIIALALFTCTADIFAQWEVPQNQDERPRRGLFDKDKDQAKKEIDPKYLAGGVPEVDGKVQWEKKIAAKGKSAQQIYDILLPYFQEFVKQEGQLPTSQVAVVNKAEKQIGVRVTEWMVFQDKALSLDRTKFLYTIIADCKDGNCNIKIQNISYNYEEDRPTAMKVKAEEWISDSEALNKKGKFRKGVKKFRIHTIDRMDEVLAAIESALNK